MGKDLSSQRLSLDNLYADVNGNIGELRLTRTARANSCSATFMDEIIQACRWLNGFDSLSIVRVAGDGKAFCAGFDLAEFMDGTPESVRESVSIGLEMCQELADLNAVTVAAIHGACVGGGMVIAAACDMRYAASDTRFFLPEVDLGVPLAWGGTAWLVRELGAATAMEAILLCQPVDVELLLQKGFLNGVCRPDELFSMVSDIIQTVGKKSRFSVRATKQQVRAAKKAWLPENHAFNDANLFYAALCDTESSHLRSEYIAAYAKK